MIFKYLRDETKGDFFRSRHAFKYLERGMKCVAWIPPKRGTRYFWPYIMWMVLVHLTIQIYIPVIFGVSYSLNLKNFTPQEFLGSVQVFFNAISLTFKVAVNVKDMWRFKEIMKMLDRLDDRYVNIEQKIEIHRSATRCNLVFLICHVIYSSYGIFAYLGSTLNGSPPWLLYNPIIDYRTSTKNLWIASTFEFIIGTGAIYADEMTDLYPVIFGLTLRTHLKLLAERVKDLRSDPKLTEEQNYELLVKCIKDHKLMLEYCDMLRSIISLTFFTQLLVIGIGLGLSLINLMFFITIWSGLSSVMLIFVLIIETFPFCYICELIEDDCYNLSLAIFYSKSVDASRRYKSTLLFFLLNTQKPINFIAGGIFPICMRTNISFAKFAFSVVTIVKQMNIIDKLKLLLNATKD